MILRNNYGKYSRGTAKQTGTTVFCTLNWFKWVLKPVPTPYDHSKSKRNNFFWYFEFLDLRADFFFLIFTWVFFIFVLSNWSFSFYFPCVFYLLILFMMNFLDFPGVFVGFWSYLWWISWIFQVFCRFLILWIIYI